MRAIALGLWLVARSLAGQDGNPTAIQAAKLQAAIRAFNDLDDTSARTLLNDLLAMAPGNHVSAQAYLYLGLIDFNAVDFDHGREDSATRSS